MGGKKGRRLLQSCRIRLYLHTDKEKCVMAESLDSLLERSLAGSNVSSTSDALVVGLHSKLLSEGFECVALGDEVSYLTCMWSDQHVYIF